MFIQAAIVTRDGLSTLNDLEKADEALRLLKNAEAEAPPAIYVEITKWMAQNDCDEKEYWSFVNRLALPQGNSEDKPQFDFTDGYFRDVDLKRDRMMKISEAMLASVFFAKVRQVDPKPEDESETARLEENSVLEILG